MVKLNSRRNWRVNHQIRASEVRVIGADGKQVGVLNLSEALAKAREENLDLIEIAPQAKPPVTKIMDLGKFLYQEEKKLRAEKKRVRGGELKEVRFSPFIADNDFETRLKRVREFLEEKDKVKVVVKFTGRQMGSTRAGYILIDRILSILGEAVSVDMQPKFLGRHLVTVISPKTQSKKAENSSQKPENSNGKQKAEVS